MSRIDEALAMERRRFLRAALAGGALLAVGGGLLLPRLRAAAEAPVGVPGDVLLHVFDDAGRDLGLRKVPRQVLSDAQWRQRLSPAAYAVMRREGTERAFSGAHERPGVPGLFRCVGCGTALYDAATEFDSGTGWPSFFAPFDPAHVRRLHDHSHGMERTEIVCARCGSHLGHVFPDGPRDRGGLRYCINSASLRFVPRADMQAQGYGDYLDLVEDIR